MPMHTTAPCCASPVGGGTSFHLSAGEWVTEREETVLAESRGLSINRVSYEAYGPSWASLKSPLPEA